MKIYILSDLHLEMAPFSPVVTDADVVILVGDIDVAWAKSSFSGVVLCVPATPVKMRVSVDDRVRVLDRDETVFGGVRFLGAAEVSGQAKSWLRRRLAEPFAGPTVVITHHAPPMQALVDGAARTAIDASSVRSLGDLARPGVVLWVHGHTHAVDWDIGGTRVVSNPRGHSGEDAGFDPALVLDLHVLTRHFRRPFQEAAMGETPESVLRRGLARGRAGAIPGSGQARDFAVEVARAGGKVLLITPRPPDGLPCLDTLVVLYRPDLPQAGMELRRYLDHLLGRWLRDDMRDLVLVAIDKSLSDDAAMSMPSLAHDYSLAIAYLPQPEHGQIARGFQRPKKRVSPAQLFDELAQIVDPVERQERVDSIRYGLRYGKARSYYADWTDEETSAVLRRLDAEDWQA